MNKQTGFTLIEMIGVMAIIAILASMATPKIFDAIQDSKVSAYLAEAQTVKLAASKFYRDTGKWPRHIPTNKNSRYHNFFVNKGVNGKPIKGWNGPYLDAELVNHISDGSYQDTLVTNGKNYACDIDGNGKPDGSFLIYRVDDVNNDIAKKISNIVDHDGDITKGKKRWQNAGRVKRYGSKNNTSILLYCLARV